VFSDTLFIEAVGNLTAALLGKSVLCKRQVRVFHLKYIDLKRKDVFLFLTLLNKERFLFFFEV